MRRPVLLLALLCAGTRAEDPPAPEEMHATLGVRARAMSFVEACGVGREEAAAGAGPGIIVEEVTPGGPAAAAGLRTGDVVTALDGHPVHNNDQLHDRVRVGRTGDEVTLRVLRRGEQEDIAEFDLTATLGEAKGAAWEGVAWELTGADGLQRALERAAAEKRRILVGTTGSESC